MAAQADLETLPVLEIRGDSNAWGVIKVKRHRGDLWVALVRTVV